MTQDTAPERIWLHTSHNHISHEYDDAYPSAYVPERAVTVKPDLDWVLIGKKAHEYGVRFQTNTRLMKFVQEAFTTTPPAAPEPTVQEAALASPIAALLPDAVAQAEKAMHKFPQPNYVISKWAEETGEVTKALIHAAEDRETWANIRGELVDSLAMLHRLFVEGDQVHGLPPLRALAEQGES